MSSNRAVENGLRAVDTVRSFLADLQLPATEQELPGARAFHVALEGPAEQGIIQVQIEAQRFVAHLVFPGYVPAEKRAAVAEFVARANWGLIEGSFELDFETGALRFRAGFDFSSTELTEPLVRNALLAGINTVERYLPGLVAVLDTHIPPRAAYRQCLPSDDGTSVG